MTRKKALWAVVFAATLATEGVLLAASGSSYVPATNCFVVGGSGYYNGSTLVSTGTTTVACPVQMDSGQQYTSIICYDTSNTSSQGCVFWEWPSGGNWSYTGINGTHSGSPNGQCVVTLAGGGYSGQLTCNLSSGATLYGVQINHN